MNDYMEGVKFANTAYKITPLHTSPWKCYLFGNRPGGSGLIYIPQLGKEPNVFVRWMMTICFDCQWVKEQHHDKDD